MSLSHPQPLDGTTSHTTPVERDSWLLFFSFVGQSATGQTRTRTSTSRANASQVEPAPGLSGAVPMEAGEEKI